MVPDDARDDETDTLDAEIIELRPGQRDETEPAGDVAVDDIPNIPTNADSTEVAVPDEPRRTFNTRLLRRSDQSGGNPPERSRGASVAISAARSSGRAVYAVGAGHVSWAKRATGAATHAHLREQVRSARAAGDRQGVADWTQRLTDARQRRTRFLRELPALVWGITRITLGVLLALALLMSLGGIWAGVSDGGLTWTSYWSMWGSFGATAAGVLTLLVPLLLLIAPVGLAVAAWNEGRRTEPPRWLAEPNAQPPEGRLVTADGVVTALFHLGIPKMDKAFKQGWQPKFHTSPIRDGDGFRTIVETPMGVTAENIADKRSTLARNLQRTAVEVWPSESEQTDYLDLWVADRGVLSKPAGAYPLLAEGAADVFTGIPVGVTQRGDALTIPLVENNLVVGGQPGQGKSNLGRVVLLGAALDPLAELRIYVFAGNGDFDAYEPRLSDYRKGADADTAEAGAASLRELYAEIERRENRLAELGAKKLTRSIAEKHPDMRPLVAFYSECHEMFQQATDAGDYAAAVVRRGRKTGVVAGFDTQSSRADAIPPKVVELVTLNACFAVKTWRSNDGFLGDGSFRSGVRATELRAGTDRGTCLITGATAESFELLKTYYIEADDDTGFDAATDVIARAMQAPGARDGQAPPELAVKERDLLTDVHTVLGGQDKTPATVARLLAEAHPNHRPYRGLSGTRLSAQLAELGAKPGASKGTAYVRAARVAAEVGSNADTDD